MVSQGVVLGTAELLSSGSRRRWRGASASAAACWRRWGAGIGRAQAAPHS